mgnify:CR=1 FL=1
MINDYFLWGNTSFQEWFCSFHLKGDGITLFVFALKMLIPEYIWQFDLHHPHIHSYCSAYEYVGTGVQFSEQVYFSGRKVNSIYTLRSFILHTIEDCKNRTIIYK